MGSCVLSSDPSAITRPQRMPHRACPHTLTYVVNRPPPALPPQRDAGGGQEQTACGVELRVPSRRPPPPTPPASPPLALYSIHVGNPAAQPKQGAAVAGPSTGRGRAGGGGHRGDGGSRCQREGRHAQGSKMWIHSPTRLCPRAVHVVRHVGWGCRHPRGTHRPLCP